MIDAAKLCDRYLETLHQKIVLKKKDAAKWHLFVSL